MGSPGPDESTLAGVPPFAVRGRGRHPGTRPDLFVVVALGGALGALARWALETAWPAPPGGVPWATFVVNVSGCLLIGLLMAVLLELTAPHRWLRPFLGVGVLGGYTTFSTYAVEAVRLLALGRPALAAAYAVGTVVAALAAVVLGTLLGRAVMGVLARAGAGRSLG